MLILIVILLSPDTARPWTMCHKEQGTPRSATLHTRTYSTCWTFAV